MKMADSASAVPISVTKHADMSSLPTRVAFRPDSTNTAYTTARLVVDSAVPAISDALSVQPRTSYDTSHATTNGPTNETTPIDSDAQNRSRKSSGSTSAPAKKVRTIDAKLAMKTSQSAFGSRSNRLP